MSHLVVYHPDTGTIIGLSDCVIIEIPDNIQNLEDLESYCEQDLEVEQREIEVDYAPIPEPKEED